MYYCAYTGYCWTLDAGCWTPLGTGGDFIAVCDAADAAADDGDDTVPRVHLLVLKPTNKIHKI